MEAYWRTQEAIMARKKRLLKEAGEPWEVKLPKAPPEKEVEFAKDFNKLINELIGKRTKPIEERVRTAIIEEIYAKE